LEEEEEEEEVVDINGPEMGDGCGVEGKGKVGELAGAVCVSVAGGCPLSRVKSRRRGRCICTPAGCCGRMEYWHSVSELDFIFPNIIFTGNLPGTLPLLRYGGLQYM
jgi:hypothetical protein